MWRLLTPGMCTCLYVMCVCCQRLSKVGGGFRRRICVHIQSEANWSKQHIISPFTSNRQLASSMPPLLIDLSILIELAILYGNLIEIVLFAYGNMNMVGSEKNAFTIHSELLQQTISQVTQCPIKVVQYLTASFVAFVIYSLLFLPLIPYLLSSPG